MRTSVLGFCLSVSFSAWVDIVSGQRVALSWKRAAHGFAEDRHATHPSHRTEGRTAKKTTGKTDQAEHIGYNLNHSVFSSTHHAACSGSPVATCPTYATARAARVIERFRKPTNPMKALPPEPYCEVESTHEQLISRCPSYALRESA